LFKGVASCEEVFKIIFFEELASAQVNFLNSFSGRVRDMQEAFPCYWRIEEVYLFKGARNGNLS